MVRLLQEDVWIGEEAEDLADVVGRSGGGEVRRGEVRRGELPAEPAEPQVLES